MLIEQVAGWASSSSSCRTAAELWSLRSLVLSVSYEDLLVPEASDMLLKLQELCKSITEANPVVVTQLRCAVDLVVTTFESKVCLGCRLPRRGGGVSIGQLTRGDKQSIGEHHYCNSKSVEHCMKGKTSTPSHCSTCKLPYSCKKKKGHCHADSGERCLLRSQEALRSCSTCKLPYSCKKKKGCCQAEGGKRCLLRSQEALGSCSTCMLPYSGKAKKGYCQAEGGKRCLLRSQEALGSCSTCKLPYSGKAKKGHCQAEGGKQGCLRRVPPPPTCCQLMKRRKTDNGPCWWWNPCPVGCKDEAKPNDSLVSALAPRGLPLSSLIIFGGPGAGKSYMWRHTLWRLEQQLGKFSVARTAPYGLVAQNVGGSTLHSWAGVGIAQGTPAELSMSMSWIAKQRWKSTKVLGIDDASVLDGEMFTKLEEVARLVIGNSNFFGGILLVINFDFAQLAPIPPLLPLWKSTVWQTLTADSTSKLVHCQQQYRFRDNVWIGLVDRTRRNTLTDIDIKILQGILSKPLPHELGPPLRLAPTHKAYKSFEDAQLERLGQVETCTYHVVDQKGQQMPLSDQHPVCVLKIGCRVMSTRNVIDGAVRTGTMALANGTQGKVARFESHPLAWWTKAPGSTRLPVVCWYPLNCQPFESVVSFLAMFPEQSEQEHHSESFFSIPLALAEALTIHKALGMTIPAGEVECAGMFASAQFFEALTRHPSFDHIRTINFQPKHVIPPVASLQEMDRLSQIATINPFDLAGLLRESTVEWEELLSAQALAVSGLGSLHIPLYTGTTRIVSHVLEAVKAGWSYFDPGLVGGECAAHCVQRAFRRCGRTLQGQSGADHVIPIRDCMFELAERDSSIHINTNAGVDIRTMGVPVPLGAVALLLHSVGIVAAFVLTTRKSPLTQYRTVGVGIPCLIFLYCEERTHLSLLTWESSKEVSSFWATLTTLISDNGVHSSLLNDVDSINLLANGTGAASGAAASGSGTVPDIVAMELDHNPPTAGGSEYRAALTELQAVMRCDAPGLPKGSIVLLFDNALSISMMIDEPTAEDYNSHPTRICPGYLWPRCDDTGLRVIYIGLESVDLSTRKYKVDYSEQGSIHLLADDEGGTCWGPLHLPLEASGGQFEYGYYVGITCELLLRRDLGYRGHRHAKGLHDVKYLGSVMGTWQKPFMISGGGTLQRTTTVTGMQAAQGDVFEGELVGTMDVTCFGGHQSHPAQLILSTPLKRAHNTGHVLCNGCSGIIRVDNIDTPHGWPHMCSRGGFNRKGDFTRKGIGKAWGKGIGKAFQEATAQGMFDDGGFDDDHHQPFEHDDDHLPEVADDFHESAPKSKSKASKDAVYICYILGMHGSVRYAAVRQHLNKSTLESAGATGVFCVVRYDVDNPSHRKCTAQRCFNVQHARGFPDCDHIRAVSKCLGQSPSLLQLTTQIKGSIIPMSSFLAYVPGGCDATRRVCESSCCSELLATPTQSGVASPARGEGGGDTPGSEQAPCEETAKDPGFASVLKKGDTVLVQGIRKANGAAHPVIEATLVEARSIRDPDRLLVSLQLPDGSKEERMVTIRNVILPSRRRDVAHEPAVIRAGSNEAMSKPEEVVAPVGCEGCDDEEKGREGDTPAFEEIMRAGVAELKVFSTTYELDVTLPGPVMRLNLVALLHEEDVPNAMTRISLQNYKLQAAAIKGGHIIRSPDTKRGRRGTKKNLDAKDAIENLRRQNGTIQCIQGDLCRMYTTERSAATERLGGIESCFESPGGGGTISPTLPQLPLTQGECDEILHSMLLADARSGGSVHRLSSNRFAVLRMAASSIGISYLNSLGYSLVTLIHRQDAHGRLTLTTNCNCSQYRNVCAPFRSCHCSCCAHTFVSLLFAVADSSSPGRQKFTRGHPFVLVWADGHLVIGKLIS